MGTVGSMGDWLLVGDSVGVACYCLLDKCAGGRVGGRFAWLAGWLIGLTDSLTDRLTDRVTSGLID